jgi:hypothetical protein
MDLMSIAAPAAEIAIGAGGQTISVRGISLRAIASLLSRFPDLLQVFNGRDIDGARLIAVAPAAAAAIMAAGAGHPNDPKAEAFCDSLALHYQAEMLMKIIELTFPTGVGPFVEALERLNGFLPKEKLQQANGAAAPDHEAPATN